MPCDNWSTAGKARIIGVTNEDRELLLKCKGSLTAQQKLVHRLDIILAAAEALDNRAISVRGLARNGQFVFGGSDMLNIPVTIVMSNERKGTCLILN